MRIVPQSDTRTRQTLELPARNILTALQNLRIKPLRHLCVEMAKAGIALAKSRDDGVNECFNILGYESVQQVQDACKEWQMPPQSEVRLAGGRLN